MDDEEHVDSSAASNARAMHAINADAKPMRLMSGFPWNAKATSARAVVRSTIPTRSRSAVSSAH